MDQREKAQEVVSGSARPMDIGAHILRVPFHFSNFTFMCIVSALFASLHTQQQIHKKPTYKCTYT